MVLIAIVFTVCLGVVSLGSILPGSKKFWEEERQRKAEEEREKQRDLEAGDDRRMRNDFGCG